jgi:hypothetical protein
MAARAARNATIFYYTWGNTVCLDVESNGNGAFLSFMTSRAYDNDHCLWKHAICEGFIALSRTPTFLWDMKSFFCLSTLPLLASPKNLKEMYVMASTPASPTMR